MEQEEEEPERARLGSRWVEGEQDSSLGCCEEQTKQAL